jgi:hypothetical protein
VEILGDAPEGSIPWYNPKTGKAYRKSGTKTETSIAVVPGPQGIAMAIFMNSLPVELTGILNSVLIGEKNEPGEDKGQQEKPSKMKRPAAAASTTTAKKPKTSTGSDKPPRKQEEMPEGWTLEQKVREDGKTKGTVDYYYISPDNAKFDSWNKVKAELAKK